MLRQSVDSTASQQVQIVQHIADSVGPTIRAPIPLAGHSESVQRALRYCDEVIRITVDYELSRDHAPRKLFTSTMIYSDAELWYRLIAMYCGLLT